MAKRPKDPNEPSRADKAATFNADKAKQARREKLQNRLVIGFVVVCVIAAGVIWKSKHHGGSGDATVKALQAVGTSPVVAGCGPPSDDGTGVAAKSPAAPSAAPSPSASSAPGPQTIVTPGQRVHYPMVPPSLGPHLANPVAVNGGGFYTAQDRPPMEGLVANLNAGWTVLWYDAGALGPDQVGKIQKAAGILRKDTRYSEFVASEWDAAYGTMPAGTPIALVRWTQQPINGTNPGGHRAFCHEISGEAILQYMIYFGAPIAAGESND